MVKRRVGLILPSVNIHVEPEFYQLKDTLPQINYFTTRVMLTDTTEETLVEMRKGLDVAVELIKTVYPEVVAFACTSGSFIKGPEGDAWIMGKIEEACKCPAITASKAMANAINAMGIKKLTLVTPYTDDINMQEKRYIESMGVEVVAMKGLQIVDAETLRTGTREQMMELVYSADVPQSDGIFISCTNVEGMYIAGELEEKLNKPVISSNSAMLWSILNILGDKTPVHGCGRLLERPV